VVVVTELTLAAARDSIRVLSWLRSNAPSAHVVVVANRVHGSTLEISRKDFENSIERKIDFAVPFDQKLAATAAKLGKTFAEAGKGAKSTAPIAQLATRVLGIGDEAASETETKGKPAKAKGGSLLGKLTQITKSAKK
jgi:pilus assembly protein CpaE